MFLDRQDNKKQIEKAYRKELKDELQQKRSKGVSNKSQQQRAQKQTFSLMANIQRQQDERKRKNQDYYSQLRMQIEEEKRMKNQKQAEIKQKQLYEENKIREQQLKLKERYQQQKLRQLKGGKANHTKAQNEEKIPLPDLIKKKKLAPIVNQQKNETHQRISDDKNEELSQFKIYSNQKQEASNHFSPFNAENNQQFQSHVYPNKVENESFNYVPRRLYKDSYYKELLGQRKRLEEETQQISELNRIFNSQRTKRKEESRGLQELRSLQKMLDNKSSAYMDFNLKDNMKEQRYRQIAKMTNLLSISNKINKDEYRKLD